MSGQIPESSGGAAPAVLVRSLFVRHRNVLMTRASLSELYADYYLHLADNGLRVEPQHDAMFKTALAAFALHLSARPRNEHISWTLNFQEPLLNIFLVGDSATGAVTGRVFNEGVKQDTQNNFYQELLRANKPLARSYVDFEGHDPLLAAERYYARSEQRPAKFFQLEEEHFVMIGAHPDYDESWFDRLDIAQVKTLTEDENVNLLETRAVHWHCGCHKDKILEVLAPVASENMDALFQGDPEITVNCPRCAARYTVTRPEMEAALA
ncbi:MAG: Hsp33 family molecular chaperone HslO [Verrucomicrobiota bacterium]